MKNYSQNNEQDVILNYFGDFKGTFLDCGANDGVTLSNTRALALLGWKGVLIEASLNAYSELFKLYGADGNFDLFPYAIGRKNKKLTFYESGELLGQGDKSLVSTFHQHEMDRFKKTVHYNPIEVQCHSWDFFADNVQFRPFDFISMDIEGSELEVLPQMDLSEVKMFCIEWNSKPELKKAYEPYFKGFKLIHTTGENLIYAR
jgi:FkbM family methyltransferase